MKPYTTVQLNVKVTDTTADQIKRLAAFNQITVAEQLRRFIEEGLAINSNAQHIDLIASIIRQELMAIYHPADIQRLVAGQLEEILKRFENIQRKSGKTSAAGYFLLFKVLMYLTAISVRRSSPRWRSRPDRWAWSLRSRATRPSTIFCEMEAMPAARRPICKPWIRKKRP